MSFIGATGLDEVQEQFDILKDEIDANASYINTLVGIPDPTHLPFFGVNILNPGLYGLVERAEVNIKALQTQQGTTSTAISGIETSIAGIETSITGIEGQVTAVEGSISTIQFVELPALATLIGIADGIAADALVKANRSLGIWDESGNNVYHKKSGNVGIGITFAETLNNKLEVNGNINIPTGSTFRIGNVPFSYSDLAGTPPVSSKWTNATITTTDPNTGVITTTTTNNIYYNTGNVGIGTTENINNKLEVGGNLNISSGSKYKIGNVNLAFSDLAGTLSYNTLTDKLTAGTNISIIANAINNTYTLPTASTSILGGVKVDGTTIQINNQVISAVAGAQQVNSDWTQTNTSLKSYIVNKPTAGANISFANNQISLTDFVGIGTTPPSGNTKLDVNGNINSTGLRINNLAIGSDPTQNIINLSGNKLLINDKADTERTAETFTTHTSLSVPSITSPAFTETIRTFVHSGGTENQTLYNITIGQNTICDILVVGGGGGGDREVGGGGGGGAVLYATNISIPANTYTIKVGKGGVQNVNGGNSEAFGATCLGGGSTAYVAWGTANNGTAGGSGSGASAGNSTVTGGTVGTSTKGTLLNSGTLYNGNVGGNALAQVVGTWQAGGGGGGGAGTAGLNSTQTLYNTRSSWIAGGRPSSGGNGIPINITGTTYYWGAGGGGAGHYGSHAGDGGLGGGGGGGGSLGSIAGLAGTDGLNSGEGGLGGTGTQKGGNGAPNTGSGGGGGGYGTSANGGNGGSGIVIIKFKSIVSAGIPEINSGSITHKTLNFKYIKPTDNLIFYYRIDESPYSWLEAYNEAIANGRRMPTYLELKTYMADYAYVVAQFNGTDTWSPCINPASTAPNNRDWIQIGNASQARGKSHFSEVFGYPSWGDNTTADYARVYWDVVDLNQPNTYNLSVSSDTSISINSGTFQYLSGNYTISVGATQSSVVIAGMSQIGQTDPYPAFNISTIAIRYSMLRRTMSLDYYKKSGFIKYVPSLIGGEFPDTGSWQIVNIDSQALDEFGGSITFNKVMGNLPLDKLQDIDMSKITTGNLDWSRISSQPALSSLSGNLDWSRISSQPVVSALSGSFPFSRLDGFYMPVDNWINDAYGYQRLYFSGNNETIIKGYSGSSIRAITFKNYLDVTIAGFNQFGDLDCNFESRSSSGMDRTGVIDVSTTAFTNQYRRLYAIYNTFTGYHRCYSYDELCNDDNVDIFRNDYIGRIVISTGKIKTDASIKKEDSEKYEWTSLYDKDGITIEEAIPIIQLSRVKKDKRVYGVLGDPKRNSNNKNRLIVNSLGEGAIYVCNSNGNIENGDYIQSSDILGYGEKQDDDLLHNYSVAKAVMDCNFELDSPYYQCYELEGGVRVAFIACTYHCG